MFKKNFVIFFVSILLIIVSAKVFALYDKGVDFSKDLTDKDFFSFMRGDRILGEKDAPITIIEYSSFSCPFCVKFYKEVLPKLDKKYISKGKINFIHRDFPMNEQSFYGAQLCQCLETDELYYSALRELFEEAYFWSYSTQYKEKVDTIMKERYGHTGKSIKKCLKNEDLRKWLYDGRLKAFMTLKMGVTPTYLIDGKKYTGFLSFEEFEEIIEEVSRKNKI